MILTIVNKKCHIESSHSCMPSPLAPDPIRVQSCVCCLFWTNRNIVWRKHLSFYLFHYPIRVMNLYIGAISKWKYILLLKQNFKLCEDRNFYEYGLTAELNNKTLVKINPLKISRTVRLIKVFFRLNNACY